MQIAKLLTANKVLTAKAYYAKRNGTPMPDKPYLWSAKSIAGILERPEYMGCTVNFKTYSKSHKQGLFSGLLNCADCGSKLHYATGKNMTPDKSSGYLRQRVEIVWNFIGALEQNDDTQTVERQRKSRTA